jgi:hypothetical protein
MAHIEKRGDQKYFIRVSKGTGKDRQFITKTFRGTLADAREFARELETAVDRGNISEFKDRLLSALDDPDIRRALTAAIQESIADSPRKGLALVRSA